MAEKKKVTKKNPEEEKKKKNTSSNGNKGKKAVSTKKDTAKNVNKNDSSKNKKVKANDNKKKEEKTTKKEVLEELDKELLNDEGYIKNQYKKEAIDKIEEENKVKPVEEKIETRGVLEDLIGTPEEKDEKTNKDIEDTGIFSSKVIIYLFILVILIICTIFYVYNEDAKKDIPEEIETSNIEENVSNEKKQPTFSQEAAIETIESYFAIKKNIEYNPIQYLQSCGFTTHEKSSKYRMIKNGSYYITDIPYENVKKHFESFISKSCFEITFKAYYQNYSGIVSCMTGQGTLCKYEIKGVERIKSARPTLKVSYTITPETGESVDKTNIFEFQVVKGKWVISSVK